MTKEAILFNEKYKLNVTAASFRAIDFDTSFTSAVSKPKKHWVQVTKRFFTTPWAVVSLVVFLAILIASLVITYTSIYSPDENIAQINKVAALDSTLNLLGSNQVVEKLVPDDYLQKLRATIGDSNFTILTTYQPLNLTLIRYNPWKLVSALDGNFDHMSIIGTDTIGRDIWTRTWAGTLESIGLALLVVTITTTFGTLVGSWIGFRVGTIADIIFIKIVGIYSSIPTIVWYTIVLFILPKSYWSLIAIFLITGWVTSMSRSRLYMWRYVNSDFMKAAETVGVSKFGRIIRHALPNFIGVIALLFVGAIPIVIEQEAIIGFLGFSPTPSSASLGNVLSEMRSTINGGAISNLWYLLLPVLIIFTLTISLRFVAFGINDAFDPKSVKGGR